MSRSLLRKKPVTTALDDVPHVAGPGSEPLKKVLGVRDLTAMGIAAVIGAGIFSTIGQAAYDGGPGVILLFLIITVACGFTALCYAEFAARVPVAGSAYTYSYVTLGEVVAWIIGWALILEYAIGNIVVAISWSSYFVNILEGVGVHLAPWLATDPVTAREMFGDAVQRGLPTADLAWTTAPVIAGMHIIVNLPAFVIVVLVTVLAYIGIRETKRTTNLMVGLKLVVLAVVIGVGVFYINTDNWTPFMPNHFVGVLKGVSAIFFAYIGFDAISTTAEECANPQRDLPRGMIYSLLICTVIYVLVTLVITGMVHYSEFRNVADPLAYVFEKINMAKIGYAVSISAVVAATSVILVFQVGQPRIWMSMSRDGLLPRRFGAIHPRFKTPGFATIVAGVIAAVPSLFIEISIMTDLTSIGTLFAFVVVCAGVLRLPARPRTGKGFHLPYINGRFVVPVLTAFFIYGYRHRIVEAVIDPLNHEAILFLIFLVLAVVVAIFSFVRRLSLIPVMGMLFCMYLMIEIPVKSWIAFFGWMTVGLVIYFGYGYSRSRLA